MIGAAPPAARGAPIRIGQGLGLVVLFLGAQVLTAAGVVLLAELYLAVKGGPPDAPAAERVRATATDLALVSGLVLSTTLVLLHARHSLRGADREPARRAAGLLPASLGSLAAGLVGGVGVALGYLLLASWLWPPPADLEAGPLTSMATEGGWRQLAWLAMVVGVAPWVEEFVFRGYLLAALAAALAAGPGRRFAEFFE